MQEALFIMGFLAGAGLLAYHHMPLEVLNSIIPKDDGAKRKAFDLPYGPHYRHKLDIYTPTEGTGPWPVVVFVHGGAWSYGSKNSYEFVGRAFAAKGYVAVLPSYRLATSDPYPSFVKDTARAINWIIRNIDMYGGNAQQMFLSGHSAGAYNVALALLDQRYFAKFNTDLSGIKGVALLSTPADFKLCQSRIAQDVFGHVQDFDATQPVNYVRPDVPPFLLLHTKVDHMCRAYNSVSLHKRLRAAGATSKLRLYKDCSHVGILLALAKPFRHYAPALNDMLEFFASTSSRKAKFLN
ncbi:alpha/beta hydrolase [Aestuariivirga litoralis]|uniref:alpha/beta hydrolase n=1 Tax=Aestuariivirga litoralis TaxID=2650924 RepID=UPI0018C45EAF|nr:alpha/beta hydrolase [Aestuariivirga litoralis]MBG1232108.1 alpha/beta hydrolase [Aestuariivirga litoralis]